MKNTLSLFVLACCLFSCGMVNRHINNPYLDAYNYVVKDLLTKKKYVSVSDSLSEFDKYMAKTLLKGHFDFSLLENNAERNSGTDSLIHDVSIQVNNPVHLLSFSRMENRMITAEIVDYHHLKQYGNSAFTTIRLYLFLFDEKMRINRVYSTNLQCN